MPRKTKQEELLKWLSQYRQFICEIDYITYKKTITILAANRQEVDNYISEKFKGLTVVILNEITSIEIIL